MADRNTAIISNTRRSKWTVMATVSLLLMLSLSNYSHDGGCGFQCRSGGYDSIGMIGGQMKKYLPNWSSPLSLASATDDIPPQAKAEQLGETHDTSVKAPPVEPADDTPVVYTGEIQLVDDTPVVNTGEIQLVDDTPASNAAEEQLAAVKNDEKPVVEGTVFNIEEEYKFDEYLGDDGDGDDVIQQEPEENDASRLRRIVQSAFTIIWAPVDDSNNPLASELPEEIEEGPYEEPEVIYKKLFVSYKLATSHFSLAGPIYDRSINSILEGNQDVRKEDAIRFIVHGVLVTAYNNLKPEDVEKFDSESLTPEDEARILTRAETTPKLFTKAQLKELNRLLETMEKQSTPQDDNEKTLPKSELQWTDLAFPLVLVLAIFSGLIYVYRYFAAARSKKSAKDNNKGGKQKMK